MIRKARVEDVKSIHKLISVFAARDRILSRSLSELYENLRDFLVYDDNGEVAACCAFHISWEDLAEIKALAVEESRQGRGIGMELVEKALSEAPDLGIKRVFTLTYVPEFFKKAGFRVIDKEELPHKIWAECVRCPKFPDCDETALILEIGDQ